MQLLLFFLCFNLFTEASYQNEATGASFHSGNFWTPFQTEASVEEIIAAEGLMELSVSEYDESAFGAYGNQAEREYYAAFPGLGEQFASFQPAPLDYFASSEPASHSSFEPTLQNAPPRLNELEAQQRYNLEQYSAPLRLTPTGVKRLARLNPSHCVIQDDHLIISHFFNITAASILTWEGGFANLNDPRQYALSVLYRRAALPSMTADEIQLLTEWALIVAVFQNAFPKDTFHMKKINTISRLCLAVSDGTGWKSLVAEYRNMTSGCRPGIKQLVGYALKLWQTDAALPPCPALDAYKDASLADD